MLYNGDVRPVGPQAPDLESGGGLHWPAVKKMHGKLKPFIGPLITTVVVMALVNRVEFLRKLVYGA